MALRLTRVGNRHGFSDGNINYLSGATTPGGDAGFQDAAPIGSKYTYTTLGDSYVKVSLVNNSILDWEIIPTDARMLAVEGSASTNATNIAAEVTRATAAEAANAALIGTAVAGNYYLATDANAAAINKVDAQLALDAVTIASNTTAAAAAQTTANTGVTNAAAAQTTANAAIPVAEKAAANGVATLGAAGTIPTSQIPALAIQTVTTVASQAAMLALVAQSGDVAIRSDLTAAAGNVFMHNGGTSGTVADWTQIDAGGYAVASVNGQTGTIVLAAADVGADVAGAAATVQSNLAAEITRATAAENSNAVLIGTQVAGTYYLAADDMAVAVGKLDAALVTTNANVTTNTTNITNNSAAIATLQGNTNGFHTASFLAVTNQIADAVAVTGLHRIEWDIAVNSNATPANIQSLKISALYNGTIVDYDEDDVLESGAAIAGLTYSVAVVAGSVELTVAATGAVDVSIARRSF